MGQTVPSASWPQPLAIEEHSHADMAARYQAGVSGLPFAIIHAQKADRQGNILISGIIGIQKEAVLAAKRSIVTVEEIEFRR